MKTIEKTCDCENRASKELEKQNRIMRNMIKKSLDEAAYDVLQNQCQFLRYSDKIDWTIEDVEESFEYRMREDYRNDLQSSLQTLGKLMKTFKAKPQDFNSGWFRLSYLKLDGRVNLGQKHWEIKRVIRFQFKNKFMKRCFSEIQKHKVRVPDC